MSTDLAIVESLPESLFRQAVLERVPGLTGFFPAPAPQNQPLPYATYARISGPNLMAHDGQSDVARARIQVSVFGNSYREVLEHAEAIALRMGGYRSVFIQGVFPQDPIDLRDPDTQIHYRVRDYIIWAAGAAVGG